MMRTHSSILFIALLISGPALFEDTVFAQLKAFPEAEGFGAFVTGGRGGTVYHVTNLNDSGAGSLRDAISQPNRIIVFDTSGVINISSALAMSNNITIAGETAPGDGITIYGNELSGSNRSNIIVRDIRIRSGMNTASDVKALNVTTGHDMIFDHLSIEWAQYDNLGMTSNSYNITLQNSISGEPISSQYSGGLIDSSTNITLSHNLWIDAKTRNPKIKGNLQYINNVVYNWGVTEGLSGGHSSANWYEDVINNYFISGPSSSSTIAGEFSSTDQVYQSGNLKDTNKNGLLDGAAMLTSDFGGGPTFRAAPYNNPTVAVTTDSATAAYAKVIAGAGALVRDPVDTTLINQVTSLGTLGAVIANETVVGGQPSMTVVTRPAGFDSDGDGIPDTWETAHGLNPNNAADRNLLNPEGYTMVEQYINELGANHGTPTWNGTSGNWLTPAYWTTGALPTNDDNAYVVGNGTGANALITVTGNLAQCFSLHIGGNSGPSGDKVSVNGTLAVTDTIYVGDQNNGTLEIDGGSVQAWNVQLGKTVGGTTYTGNLLLNGGILKTYQVVLGGGTPGNWTSGGSCTWSGGTVQAIGALNFAVPATIGAGGATIDSNGFACTVSGVLSGNGGLTKIGTGTLTLTTSNTFSGDTKISGGNITLSTANALQKSTLDYNGYGGTLSFGTLTGAAFGGLKGSQNLSLTNTGSAAVQLQAGGNGQSTSYSGVLSGAGSLTKTGTGSLILSGANAYTGSTTISAGTLALGGNNVLPASSSMILSGGTLATDSFSQTNSLGKLTLTSDSMIDMGVSGGSILNFADSHLTSWSGTLTISNWNGSLSGGGADELFFGSSNSALALGQLNDVIFTNPNGLSGSYQAGILATGEIVPVPEPAAITLLIAAALGMLFYRKRRQ
ncbi:MAG: autotransporter-associated beta strand repeat-containing protein [Thermoguttaceae bacterium]